MPKAVLEATQQVPPVQPAQVKEPLSHIQALDGIRGVAILAVLFFHLFWSNTHTGNRLLDVLLGIKAAGWAGVDLFFALSGFLITGILFDSLADPHYFRNFYARRVFRIFPLYYGIVLATLIGLFLAHDATPLNLHLLALVAVYLQNTPLYMDHALGAITYNFTGHFWSLAVEEQFYLVWPVLIFLVRRRRRLMVLALALAAVAPVARAILIAHHTPELDLYTATYCRQDSLLCGAWLALAIRGPLRARVLRFAWLPFTLALLSILAISITHGDFDYNINPAVNLYGFSLVAIAGASAIALALRPASLTQRLMSNATLRFFGRYSYGLYIYHELIEWSPVGTFVNLPYWSTFASKWVHHMVVFFGILAATIAVSLLSYHLYEKPFLSLKRYFNYDRKSLRHPTVD